MEVSRIVFYFILVLIFFVTSGKSSSTGRSNVEYKLVNDLLRHYKKEIRPIKQSGDITYVFVELSLFDVLELITQEEVLRTNTELIMKWNDPHLTWDPSKYDNMSLIRLQATEVWYPDVVLYNTADGNYEKSLLSTNVIVKYDGLIELVIHAIFISTCGVDVLYYPFDQQLCNLRFASWTYDQSEIQLVLGPSDISKYKNNPEFELENFYADQESMFNPCCVNPMSAVTFHIQLQRRTKFSMLFFIMPGILINLAAVLVFSIPAESGEKIVLGISAMIAMIVFLMEMSNYIPPTDVIPLAGLYYGSCLSLISVNIIFSVAVLNFNVAGERKRFIPLWIKAIILFLVKFLKNKVPDDIGRKWQKDLENWESFKLSEDEKERVIRVAPLSDEIKRNQKLKVVHQRFKDPFEQRMILSLETITSELESIDDKDLSAEEHSFRVSEWKFISRVVDRLLFYVFLAVGVGFNIYLLTSSPFRQRFEYCPFRKEECKLMTSKEIMDAVRAGAGHTGLINVENYD